MTAKSSWGLLPSGPGLSEVVPEKVSGGEWIAVTGQGSEGVGTDIKNCAAMLELELIVRRGDLGDRSLASIAQTAR